ncbi:MAG: hypothetical protein ABFC77_13780 [Thermoguttaceae bacterium]
MTTHSQFVPRPVSMRPRRTTWLLLGLFMVIASLGASLLSVVRRPAASPESPIYAATAYVVEQSSPAEKLAIPLSCENADRRRAQRMANALADCYAADQRQQWQRSIDAPRQAARTAVDRAKTAVRQAQERLDAFRRQPIENAGKSEPPSLASPGVDNPRWVELDRQLEQRRQQREQLLKTRTPLHPLVRDIDARIDDLRRKMADVPRQIPGKQPVVKQAAKPSPPSEPLASLSYDVDIAQKNLEQAEQAERQLSMDQENAVGPQWTVIPAETTPSSPTEPLVFDAPRLAKTVMLPGLMSLVGLALLWRGAGIDPPLGSVVQVARTSGVPVVGVLKADDPIADPIGKSRRQSRARRALLALGLLLAILAPLAILLP